MSEQKKPLIKLLEEKVLEICHQRDELAAVLADLICAVHSGHINGTFDDSKAHRKHCSCGHSVEDIRVGCPDINSPKCQGWDCPMEYHHYNIMSKLVKAQEVLAKDAVEMPKFSPSAIPSYDPDLYTYLCSPEWFVRNFALFANEFPKLAQKDKDVRLVYKKAFDALLAIGMETVMRKEISVDADELERQILGHNKKKNPNVNSIFGYAVAKAFEFRSQFNFLHDYPSADWEVYCSVVYHIAQTILTGIGIDCEGDKYAALKFLGQPTVPSDLEISSIEQHRKSRN